MKLLLHSEVNAFHNESQNKMITHFQMWIRIWSLINVTSSYFFYTDLNIVIYLILSSLIAVQVWSMSMNMTLRIRDVKAVEYFLFPLSAPYKVTCFRVCVRFQLLSSKCFRFHKNSTASSASTSLHHVLWKMLSLPDPQKFKCFRVCFRFQLLSSKCFRLHENLTASTSLLRM